jgi:MFS family permease
LSSVAIQGFGAALLTAASLAILGATFNEHERSQAIGISAGAGALTSAAGPVLGGWLVDLPSSLRVLVLVAAVAGSVTLVWFAFLVWLVLKALSLL